MEEGCVLWFRRVTLLWLFPSYYTDTTGLREADRHTFRHAARLALRANPSVVAAVVDLEGLGNTTVLGVLIHAALTGLPDAKGLVVPDLVVAHKWQHQRENVVLRPVHNHVDELRRQIRELGRQIALRDERPVSLLENVLREITQPSGNTADVVVGAPVGSPVITGAVTGVLLGRVVKLAENPPPCRSHEISDFFLGEELIELVAGEEDLALFLSARVTVLLGPVPIGHGAS